MKIAAARSCWVVTAGVTLACCVGSQCNGDGVVGLRTLLDPQLVGRWSYESTTWNELSGYSMTTFVETTYNADGTFEEAHRTVASGLPASDVFEYRGSWSTANGVVTLTYEDGTGAQASYYIEDQADGRVMMTQAGWGGEQRLWTYRG